MKNKILLFGLLELILIFKIFSRDPTIYVYAFDSYHSIYPKKMILVGEIKSKVKAAEIHDSESPIKEYDIRKDVVTVKVINRKGLKIGQKLYIVYKNPHHEKFKNAFIMGEMIVTSILKHPFYGLVLTGEGNFLRVREGYFVVRTLESENIEKAYFLKRKGDYYFNEGAYQKAIEEYLKAIQQDADLVEAHASLGIVYYSMFQKDLNMSLLLNALQEFQIAWKLKDRFRYQLEYFQYLTDYFSSLLDLFLYQKYTFFSPYRKKEVRNTLNRLEEISESCIQISDHIECKMAKAISLYYQMEYVSSQENKKYRKKYDELYWKVGKILKLIEEKENRKNYKKFQEYQMGQIRFINNYIDIVQYEFVFIFYYYDIFQKTSSIKNWEQKQKLKRMLLKHINLFFRLQEGRKNRYRQDLEVLKIKNQIESF